MTITVARPPENEYTAFYAGYIQRVRDGDLFGCLAGQINTLRSLLSGLSAEQADFRFGPAEWSIKEMIGHVNDAERVFAFRALHVCRNDQGPIPGFDQDDWVRAANFGERTLPDLLEEFALQRRANILTSSHLPPQPLLL